MDTFDPALVTHVTSQDRLDRLVEIIRHHAYTVVIDLETTGLNERTADSRIAMAALTIPLRHYEGKPPTTWVVPLSHPEGPWPARWREVSRTITEALHSARVPLVNHNIKFDLRWLYAVTGIDLSRQIEWDTVLSSRLLDENNSAALKEVVPRTFDISRWDDHDLSSPGAAERVPYFDLALYAARDTYWTWVLYKHHRLLMGAVPDVEYEIEDFEVRDQLRLGRIMEGVSVPTVRTLTAIEQRGVFVDRGWVIQRLADEEETVMLRRRALDALDPEHAADHPDVEDRSYEPTSNYFRDYIDRAVEQGRIKVTATTPAGRPSWNKGVLIRASRKGNEIADNLLAYRRASKSAQYLRSWLEFITDFDTIHATYRPAQARTGRLSCADPNMQQVSAPLRPAFLPRPGYLIVEADYSQIELRIAALVAGIEPVLAAYQEGADLHRLMASDLLEVPVAEVTPDQRQLAKACIAEGELVTTDAGLVPIEKVTTDHRVWDGAEFVTHEGTVSRGKRDVLRYDGLWATPDHIVFTELGEMCHASAATLAIPLVRGGPAVEGSPHPDWQGAETRASSGTGNNLLTLPAHAVEGREQSETWAGDRLHVPAQPEIQRSEGDGAGRAVRRHAATLQAWRGRQPQLRGQGHRVALPISGTLHPVGVGAPASRDVPGSPVRPDRQRRPLRTGEPASGHGSGEPDQQAEQRSCLVHGYRGCPQSRLALAQSRPPQLPIQPRVDHETAAAGSHHRRVVDDDSLWSRAQVYDLAEAGPRHRFVVSGRVVRNCNFGLIFGMGADSFQTYAFDNYDVSLTLEESEVIREGFFNFWQGLDQWHSRIVTEAHQTGRVVNLLGRVRHLPSVADGDPHAEKQAINFPVQSMASDLMMLAAARIEGASHDHQPPAVPEARIVATVHDSIVVEVPEDGGGRHGGWKASVVEIMRTMADTTGLLAPFRVSLDVPIEVEAKVGSRWGDTDTTMHSSDYLHI